MLDKSSQKNASNLLSCLLFSVEALIEKGCSKLTFPCFLFLRDTDRKKPIYRNNMLTHKHTCSALHPLSDAFKELLNLNKICLRADMCHMYPEHMDRSKNIDNLTGNYIFLLGYVILLLILVMLH